MINSVTKKTFVTIVLVCTSAVFGQPSPDIVRLDLKDRSSALNRLPNTLSVYIEVATAQPNDEQGIQFTINIENNSTETVRIIDPIDTTHISLFGLTNPKCKSLPNTESDYSICRIRSYSAKRIKEMFDDKRTRRPFLAFDTDGAKHNPRLKTVNNIVPWEPPQNQPTRTSTRSTPLSAVEVFEGTVGGKLTLESGQHFQAVIKINRVIADYKAHKKADAQWLSEYCIRDDQGFCTLAEGAPPRPEPEIIPIPSGTYSLYVSISLSTDNAGSYTATSYSVLSDGVTIQLGEPTNPKQKDTNKP